LHVSNTMAHGTTLVVDDATAPVMRQVSIGQQTVVGYNQYGPIWGFAPVISISSQGVLASISYDPGAIGSLDVYTGTGGAVIIDSDNTTPTSLVGAATAAANRTNILYEQLPGLPPGAWVRAGTGYGSLPWYGNLRYWGF